MSNQKTNMKNFITVHGTDCDGGFCPSITKFTTEQLAARSAKHSNDWSDGLVYVAEDEEQAKRYAEYYGINVPNYAFDENDEIVDDPPPHTETDIQPDYDQLTDEL